MGGLAKTSAGYIFAGTYGIRGEKPRNVFVLTFDEALDACSRPIYITDCTREDGHAGNPGCFHDIYNHQRFIYFGIHE